MNYLILFFSCDEDSSSSDEDSTSFDEYFTNDDEEMFKRYDKDGDGFVTHEELKAFAKKCGVSISEVEIEEMIKDADTNEDGKVTFEEYKAMMNKRWLFVLIIK
jgi:Ca2+-binding EF-hand superfamily protein